MWNLKIRVHQRIHQKEKEFGVNNFSLQTENVDDIWNKEFSMYFLSKKSLNLFKRFDINPEFSEKHPTDWNSNSTYLSDKNIMNSLQIINDTAKRGVKLKEEFNKKFTKNENQNQFLLPRIFLYLWFKFFLYVFLGYPEVF